MLSLGLRVLMMLRVLIVGTPWPCWALVVDIALVAMPEKDLMVHGINIEPPPY